MRNKAVVALYGVLFAVHVSSSLFVARLADFPTTVDERAHYSFVAEMAARPTPLPRYETMRLIDLRDGTWSDERTYLNHPPLYYALLSLLPLDATWLRSANVALSAFAVGLLCVTGLRRLRQPVQHIAFAAAVALCPKAQLLGGQVNNDNLALLGGALVLAGLTRERSLAAAVVIGAGFVLGAHSKLTAGLLLGLLIAFSHLHQVRALPRAYLAVLGFIALVGIAPYVANLVAYGAPIYMNKAFLFVPEAQRLPLHLAGFTLRFFRLLAESWSAFEPAWLIEIVPLLVVLALAFGSRDRIGGCGLAATGLVMAVHLAFLYRTFLETGYAHGAFFRYYLPIWPAIALGAASGLLRLPERARGPVALALMLLLAGSSVPLANYWRI